MTPISTPKEALYTETGLLDIEHIALKKKISMLQRLRKNPSKILSAIFENNENTWEQSVTKEIEQKGITQTIAESKSKLTQQLEKYTRAWTQH